MLVLPVVMIISLAVQDSLQTCSSTVAITTCTWDTLRSPRPLQVNDYKPFLSFSKGDLENIPNGVFRFLPEVTTLQLSGNKIQKLKEESLEGLVNLKQLNLYDNQLTAVNHNSLKHCGSLEKLDLGMNKINFIDDKAFEHLRSLRQLNLAFNSLKSLPAAINSLINLNTLRIDNNAIETINANAFSKLSRLEELAINDNKLTRIEQNSFKGLTKLKTLDLGSNFLSDINVGDLVGSATDLKLIRISINDFKCDNLRKMLAGFRKNNVEVARGVSKSANSENGISCKTA